MDEIWQRHKTFLLQVLLGGLAFLIALGVMSNSFSGADDPEELARINVSKKASLQKAVDEKRAPSAGAIASQRERAADAERQIREMASMCASLEEGDEYVRENILWTVRNIGGQEASVATYFNLYKQIPQTCLSRLREEARAALVARASQDRVAIEETLGFGGAVADDEVPMALHGLALVTDVIRRVLETNATWDPEGKRKVTAVREIRVAPRNSLDRDLTWIAGLEVHVALHGDPDPVFAVMRSFNSVENPMRRMTVFARIEGITRDKSGDEDAVKAAFVLLGLQHRGVKGAER